MYICVGAVQMATCGLQSLHLSPLTASILNILPLLCPLLSSPTSSPASSFLPSLLTEASKYLLQYLAQCSGHAGKVDRVKDRLIQSNPVLEVGPALAHYVPISICTHGEHMYMCQ